MFSLFDPTVGEAGRDRTDTVVVPIGAVEDHSRHLALDSDNFIIWSICEEAAQRADRNILLVRRRGAGPGAGGHSAGPGSSQSDTAGSNVLTGRFGHYFKFGAGPASRSRLSAGSWQNSSKLSIDLAALCEGVEAQLSGLIHAFPNVTDEALHASPARRERS